MDKQMRDALLRDIDQSTDERDILIEENAMTGNKALAKMIEDLNDHIAQLYRRLEIETENERS